MHIAAIELENYMPYAGHHRIELAPMVYGVRAEWVGRPGRSNWAGKTSLLEAIPLALYGKYPAKKNVDDWITDGTDMGRVAVTFDSGVTIEHKRTRGDTTTVQLFGPGRQLLARGDAARAQVENILGLNRDDFFATCFFRQKEMSSIVAMQPGAFAQTIIGWLRLEALEAVEEAAGDAEAEAAAIVAQEDAAREAALKELRSRGDKWDSGLLARTVKANEDQLARLEFDYKSSITARSAARVALDATQEAVKLETLAQEAWELREQAGAVEATLEDQDALETAEQDAANAVDVAQKQYTRVADELRRLESACAGEFDGQCPVMRKACPVRSVVVQTGKKLQGEVRECKARKQEAVKALNAANEVATEVLRKLQLNEKKCTEAETKRARATAIDAKVAKAPRGKLTLEQARAEYDRVSEQVATLSVKREQLKAAIATDRALLGRLNATHERSSAAAEAKVRGRVRRAAKLAQRMIAQGAMGWIANEGNSMLSAYDIDLQFQVRWAKEAKGFEPICAQCGRVFQGKGAKPCPCGKPRQPRLLDRPSLDMSAKSGAADDLVGMAIRLGAASWLRSSRGSTWASCIIDEPFGALDSANRDSVLTALLSSLRGRYGFEQAFVVAHHEEIISAMPGTVRVVAGPGGSRLEVMD